LTFIKQLNKNLELFKSQERKKKKKEGKGIESYGGLFLEIGVLQKFQGFEEKKGRVL
jgi:hypothetical protein